MKGSDEKLKILELPDELYQYYKTMTNDNENITKDQAAKKLTRNVMLGMLIPPRNKLDRSKGNKMYFYGNLHICVKNDRKIVHIHNHGRGKFFGGWFKDEEKYIELTKKLGIE
jgi:hypothetical protein